MLSRSAQLLAFLACLVSGSPLLQAHAAEIVISPTTTRINPNTNQATVWLYNSAQQPWRAEVRLYRWQQDGNREVLEPATDAAVSPSQIDIPAQGKQLLRLVRLGPPPAREERSYRLVVTEIGNGSASPLLRYSSPMFTAPAVAPPDNGPQLRTRIESTDSGLRLSMHNTGSLHARIADLQYIDAQGKRNMIDADLAGYVLPGQTRRWLLPPTAKNSAVQFVARINGGSETQVLLNP